MICYDAPTLATLPVDIMRRIIQIEKPDSVAAIRLISIYWNTVMQQFLEERTRKPSIQRVRCIDRRVLEDEPTRVEVTIQLSESNAKLVRSMLSSSSFHCEWKNDSVKMVSSIMRRSIAAAASKWTTRWTGNKRKYKELKMIPDEEKITRLRNLLWRFSSIEELRMEYHPLQKSRLDAIRRCLSNIPIRKMCIGTWKFKEEYARNQMLDLLRTYSVKKCSISADEFDVQITQKFIMEAMNHVQSIDFCQPRCLKTKHWVFFGPGWKEFLETLRSSQKFKATSYSHLNPKYAGTVFKAGIIVRAIEYKQPT